MAESADEQPEARTGADPAVHEEGDASDDADAPRSTEPGVDGPSDDAVRPSAGSAPDATTDRTATPSRKLRVETRIEAIETLYDLWAGENDVKTNKLYVYIVVQSILVTAYAAGANAVTVAVPLVGRSLPLLAVLIPFVGIGTSWMSFVSIGRTVAFQKAWKYKRRDLVESAPEPVRSDFDFYPTAEDKAAMPWWGRLGSKYILLAPPVVGLALWTLVLLGGAAVA